MSHPLEEQVRVVQQRARRLVVVHGVCSFLAAGILTLFALGAADYCCRFHARPLRVIASATAFAALLAGFWRYVRPAVAFRASDVQVARQIERRFPQLGDQLSNAIAFLRQPRDDVWAGSIVLRDACVAQAAAALDGLRLEECLDSRGVTRRALLGGLATACVLAICLSELPLSILAARRLAWPLSHDEWPRRHQLVLTERPQRLAVGDDFEVQLIDARGHLPADVQLQYRFDRDPTAQIESQPMKLRGEKMVGRLEHVTRSFQYRAVGGDDDTMDWFSLAVVEPPRISDLRVQLHPPAYTGLPVQTSDRHIRAWEGTRAEITGRVDKPLRSLSLRTNSGEVERTFLGSILGKRREFSLPANPSDPWVLRTSGNYAFELIDIEGYSGKDLLRSEISVRQDLPPSVIITSPLVGSYFTVDALVPVRAVVKDDLAIRKVELHGNGHRMLLFDIARKADPRPEESGRSAAEGGETRQVDYAWDLSRLSGLKAGDTIEFFLSADDLKPQSVQSERVRFLLVSADELQARTDQREAYIAGRLREALRLQTTVRSHVRVWETRQQQEGDLTRDDVDHLQSGEMNQRQVQRLIAGDPDGAMALTEKLLSELQSNRVDRPQVAGRLTSLLNDLRRLARDTLPLIEQEMTWALKLFRGRSERGQTTAQATAGPATAGGVELSQTASLQAAGRGQDQVIATLESLLGQLSQWEGYRQIVLDLGQLRRAQEPLARETASRPITAQDLGKLSPAAKANLSSLAERQYDGAREFDRLQTRITDAALAWREADPLAAAALSDAAQAARSLALGGLMREVAKSIEGNQIGQATRLQKDTLRGLDEMLDLLANRRDQVLDRVLRSMQNASKELQSISQEQVDARSAIDDLAAKGSTPERADRLQRFGQRQQDLAQRAKNLAQQLKSLRATLPAETIERAAGELEAAAQAGGQQEIARAQDAARGAQQTLAQAQKELVGEIAAGEGDLRNAQQANLRQAIVALKTRQEALLESTRLLLAEAGPRASPAKSPSEATRHGLARRQRELGSDSERCAADASASATLRFALLQASLPMQDAARQLEQGARDERAAPLQSEAIERLRAVLESFASHVGEASPQPAADTASEEIRPPSNGNVAELRLLCELQRDIHRRTAELERLREKQQKGTAGEPPQFTALAADQGRLAELLLTMASGSSTPLQSPAPATRELQDRELDKALQESGIPGFLGDGP